MPPCGNFSHDLLDPRDRGTWDGIKIVRCTIVSIHPKTNTADVELGEYPPASVPTGELTDIDCPDIPVFEGDGWSDDEMRRKCNNVPIFYHCQKTEGTVASLKLGHMAFRIPLPELLPSEYTTQEVQERHATILREKALFVYFPPTAEEVSNGIPGTRYIYGHTDRNDLAPCRSEWMCFRIIGYFEDDISSGNYGFAEDPSTAIITIVDPILGIKYKGLEPFGVTFPCLAKYITDKAQAIVIDENTAQEDIDFLDTLHAITPLYDNAFVYILPNNGNTSSATAAYHPPSGCHEWQPTRLCWMSHYFDQNLQAVSKTDPRQYDQPWTYEGFETPEPYYVNDHIVRAYWATRTFGMWPDWSYYTSYSVTWHNTSIVQPHYQDTVLLNDMTYDGATLIYLHSINQREIFSQFVSIPSGWISSISFYNGFHHAYSKWDYSRITETEWSLENGTIIDQTTWENTVSHYVPWIDGPWYEVTLSSLLNTSGLYVGQPGYALTTYWNYPAYFQSASVIRGRKGMYGIVNIAHHDNDGYSAEIVDNNSVSFSQDETKIITKATFAYNPALIYGDAPVGEDYHVSKFDHLADPSTFMESVLYEMHLAYMRASVQPGMPYLLGGTLSAFVVDVLE